MGRRSAYRFRLYIAGDAPNSAQAIANLDAICRTHLPGRHEIEIVDVLREPRRALAGGILMTPTLLRLSPGPAVKIVGTLANTELTLRGLGLGAEAA